MSEHTLATRLETLGAPTEADRAAALEWANYAATCSAAQATPGLELVMREDVILTASALFPLPDANHACRLRCSAEHADELLEEIGAYYAKRGLPATIYVSPACAPADLERRLRRFGYVPQELLEAWLILEPLTAVAVPPMPAAIAVRRVGTRDAAAFARVFLAAFEMSQDFAPVLAEAMEPSLGLPDGAHYLAEVEGEPVGTLSLLTYGGFGVLGSAGVMPAYRRRGALTALATAAIAEARERGIETLMVQTTTGTPFERLLRISGFQRAFTRAQYVLPWTG